MVLAPKIFKAAKNILRSEELIYKPASKIATKGNSTLLSFGAKNEQSMLNTSGVVRYRVKPDITMPIRPETLHLTNPAIPITADLLKSKDVIQLGELGNVSVRLAQKYKAAETSATKEIKEIFDGFDISVRAKGANSIFSKLERMTIKGNKTIKTDNDATQIIQDAIGGRIHLKDLTPKDVTETINNIKIEGKALSASEKNLVQRLFNNEKLTETERITAEKLAKPIKTALAERHSEPAFKKFMLSGLKDALNRKVTTFEQLEQAGIRKDLLYELKTNPNIKPLRMTEVNNYKGVNGIAYFSDNQIRQFERLQLATGERFDIITCSENIDLAKYGLEGLSKSAKEAIKPSGYTTGQINVKLSDGTLAEIQVRGSGQFGEYEHFKYDSTKGKNTLGKILETYKNTVRKLKGEDAEEYDRYISKFYDYYRAPELGIKIPRPQLDKKFDPVLSEESMKKLYELDKADQAKKLENFIPHIEYAA